MNHDKQSESSLEYSVTDNLITPNYTFNLAAPKQSLLKRLYEKASKLLKKDDSQNQEPSLRELYEAQDYSSLIKEIKLGIHSQKEVQELVYGKVDRNTDTAIHRKARVENLVEQGILDYLLNDENKITGDPWEYKGTLAVVAAANKHYLSNDLDIDHIRGLDEKIADDDYLAKASKSHKVKEIAGHALYAAITLAGAFAAFAPDELGAEEFQIENQDFYKSFLRPYGLTMDVVEDALEMIAANHSGNLVAINRDIEAKWNSDLAVDGEISTQTPEHTSKEDGNVTDAKANTKEDTIKRIGDAGTPAHMSRSEAQPVQEVVHGSAGYTLDRVDNHTQNIEGRVQNTYTISHDGPEAATRLSGEYDGHDGEIETRLIVDNKNDSYRFLVGVDSNGKRIAETSYSTSLDPGPSSTIETQGPLTITTTEETKVNQATDTRYDTNHSGVEVGVERNFKGDNHSIRAQGRYSNSDSISYIVQNDGLISTDKTTVTFSGLPINMDPVVVETVLTSTTTEKVKENTEDIEAQLLYETQMGENQFSVRAGVDYKSLEIEVAGEAKVHSEISVNGAPPKVNNSSTYSEQDAGKEIIRNYPVKVGIITPNHIAEVGYQFGDSVDRTENKIFVDAAGVIGSTGYEAHIQGGDVHVQFLRMINRKASMEDVMQHLQDSYGRNADLFTSPRVNQALTQQSLWGLALDNNGTILSISPEFIGDDNNISLNADLYQSLTQDIVGRLGFSSEGQIPVRAGIAAKISEGGILYFDSSIDTQTGPDRHTDWSAGIGLRLGW